MNKPAQLKRPPRNQDLRAAIDGAGLRHWWVAEELGISCGTLSNRLRKELAPEEKQEILSAVRRLADRLGARVPEPVCQEITLETRTTLPGRSW